MLHAFSTSSLSLLIKSSPVSFIIIPVIGNEESEAHGKQMRWLEITELAQTQTYSIALALSPPVCVPQTYSIALTLSLPACVPQISSPWDFYLSMKTLGWITSDFFRFQDYNGVSYQERETWKMCHGI